MVNDGIAPIEKTHCRRAINRLMEHGPEDGYSTEHYEVELVDRERLGKSQYNVFVVSFKTVDYGTTYPEGDTFTVKRSAARKHDGCSNYIWGRGGYSG